MDITQQKFLRKLRFSVSMCVYEKDNSKFLHQAIESIINQSVKPDEIILVVDGPIPFVIDKVIENFENEENFKVIRLDKNVGHGNARRIGLENCSYDLVALMDADDISLPDRFEKQLNCFYEDGSLSVVGGNIKEFVGTIDNIIGIRKVPQKDQEIKKYLKTRCPLNQVTVMFKVSEVEAVGGYIDWFNEEDYYLWVRMFQNNAIFKNLNDILVYVRVGNEMYLRRGGWRYFKSEFRLQKYMFDNKIVNIINFVINISIRFVVQVLMPNKVRGFIFKKFARTKVSC